MRRVRYNVAATLDGFIAGPYGEYDWIPNDPTVDFAALFARVDTILLGRRSWEAAQSYGNPGPPGSRVFVFSRTLQPEDCSGVTLVRENARDVVQALRSEPGDGDIWLFGGGGLFRELLDAGQVDSVEITVAPVILGAGIRLIADGGKRANLKLVHSHVYPSGMIALHYDVIHSGSG